MANYSLVINSQFNPFSYAELLAPVAASTEAHQKAEETYNTLSSQAATLKAKAEQEAITNPGSKWVKRYNDYATKLEQSASDLARYGLQPNVRQQISEARRDYFNSVDPAAKAIAQQQKLSDMQYAQNPALRMVYGDMPTIDQLIGDMSLKPVSYSGQDIYTQAMTSSRAASARNTINEFMKDPRFADYIKQVKATGYDAKTINDMLAVPELKGIVNMVKTQFGGFDGVSKKNQEKLEGEILKGLFDGVVYTKDQSLTYDQVAAQQRQFAHDIAMEARKQRAAGGSGGGNDDPEGRRTPGETVPIHFTNRESAGAAMKNQAAKQSAAYIGYRANKGDKDALKIVNYWKTHGNKKESWETKATRHWVTNGFNGSWLKNNKGQWLGLGIGLRKYLRDNLTRDERLINTWTSDLTTRYIIVPNGPASAGGIKNLAASNVKAWGDWNNRSTSAYTVNGIVLTDKPEQLKTYLARVFDRNVMGGKVKLHDLQGLDTQGNYTYSKSGTDKDDLPLNKSGEVDYSRIHRMLLSNGDFLLYWEKNGNTIQKVLKKEDISREAVQEWNTFNNAHGASFRRYAAGKMSKNEQDKFLKDLGQNHMYNVYSLSQEVNVKDYDVK